ncbi:hypothetical protein Tco_1530134 [Tanacetum coccineum]
MACARVDVRTYLLVVRLIVATGSEMELFAIPRKAGVRNDCRSCKVRVGSNGNLLWEASVLLCLQRLWAFGLDNALAVFIELMSRSKEEYESYVKMIVESLKEEKMYVKFSNNVKLEQRGSYLVVEGTNWNLKHALKSEKVIDCTSATRMKVLMKDCMANVVGEFKQPEFEGYGVKVDKSVCEKSSKEITKTLSAPIIEDWVSNDEEQDESKSKKKTVIPTAAKIEFVRPKQQEKPPRKPVKYAEMYRKIQVCDCLGSHKKMILEVRPSQTGRNQAAKLMKIHLGSNGCTDTGRSAAKTKDKEERQRFPRQRYKSILTAVFQITSSAVRKTILV